MSRVVENRTSPNNKKDQRSKMVPSKIERDLTNGHLMKLLELLDTQVFPCPFSGSDRWRFLGMVDLTKS